MQNLSRRSLARGLILAVAGPMLVSASRSAAAEPSLALKGYDPVAYFTLGSATRGTPEFEYEWDEQRYRFIRAEHREFFRADPVRYAPQFAGFCAMALGRGQVLEADPEYWVISNGKLYLFSMAVGPERFRRDPAGNAQRAETNRPLVER